MIKHLNSGQIFCMRIIKTTICLLLLTSHLAFSAEWKHKSQFIGTYCTNPCCSGSTSRPWDLPCIFKITKDEFLWAQWDDWNKRFARKYVVTEQTEGKEIILIFGGDSYSWYAHESLSNVKHRLTLSANHSNQFARDSIELHEESWSKKEQKWISSESMYIRRIDPSLAEDQTDRFMHSKSAPERKEALQKINQQIHPERAKYNEIGLRDPSPEVREIAAYFLRGDPNYFVPILINVMANDPNANVRSSAGSSLSSFYTDNGTEGYDYIKPLEDNLDNLLKGLDNVETVGLVVDILGSDSFAPCYMSMKNREKILNALRYRLKIMNWIKVSEVATWDNVWNGIEFKINIAIENISKCNRTKRKQP